MSMWKLSLKTADVGDMNDLNKRLFLLKAKQREAAQLDSKQSVLVSH